MELTAKTLQEVTFGAKVRGYDPAEVDEFIAAVAEGVEELHERLRRATDRATRAEQQLAAAPNEAATIAAEAPTTASTGSPEISKVWERAVMAAEQAMEEAKGEAQRLLDEARSRADTQLNDARREADTTVSTAKAEAARITEESQAQLKIEIQRLESSRDGLTADVNGLSGFLDGERERLRTRLNEALAAIDQYGSAGAAPFVEPAPPSSFVSDAAPVTTATDDWTTAVATSASEPEWTPPETSVGGYDYNAETVTIETETDFVAEEAVAEDAVPGWARAENSDQMWTEENAQGISTEGSAEMDLPWSKSESETESNPADDADADSDPFLAELRRAVQDDGPLGPRTEEEQDSSLSDLYAADDENNGFFRRNK